MKRSSIYPLVWQLLFLFLCGPFARYAFASVSDELQIENSDFMRRTAYAHPDQVATDISPSGAEGPVNMAWDQTHSGKWYIEEQRNGAEAVSAGISQNDPAAIDRGLKVLHWGFEQQQPDGGFDCPDAFHSTSFFVEATARSCLLLQASSYHDRYASEIDWMKPRILKAALWMTTPSVEGPGRKNNAPYTHRRFLVGAALGMAGVLCDDQQLVEHSKEYIRDGCALQDPSGYNPEKGGYDSSYHAVGLVFAERYYDFVADEATKKELFKMLKGANHWLRTRILPDGTINSTGNTRTGFTQETDRRGKYKAVSYAQTARTFYRWSLISGDSSYAKLADHVIEGERIFKRESKMKS
jgi:hypothetical protein